MKQRKWKRLLSVILAVALVCSSWTGLAVQAEDEQVVYVSASSGNDANTGAVDAPVATLAKAYALLLEGDVKENADAQGYIVVMDALAAIGDFNYNSGALTYEHAGKVEDFTCLPCGCHILAVAQGDDAPAINGQGGVFEDAPVIVLGQQDTGVEKRVAGLHGCS